MSYIVAEELTDPALMQGMIEALVLSATTSVLYVQEPRGTAPSGPKIMFIV